MSIPITIAITGASSGLGRALAEAYASPHATLFLCGRNQDRLKETAIRCERKGATVHTALFDIRDSPATQAWVTSCYQTMPIDILFANAGISGGTSEGLEPETQVAEIFETNTDSVLHTIHPAIAALKSAQHPAQIVIISSLASVLALPGCPAYSASKAAIRYYGEALTPLLRQDHIYMTVILPGYIDTPMTEHNDFPMPGMLSAEKAAHYIKQRLLDKPSMITFPRWFYLLLKMLSYLPVTIRQWILMQLPRKKSLQNLR